MSRSQSLCTPNAFLLRNSTRNSGFSTPNEQAIRVVRTLREHFGRDYLPDGLRSMNLKVFITTMAFFMKSVIGNSRGSQIDAEKLTVDDITKYLVELGYSAAKQSMSWMKTPNAPHALNSLVDLLQWLCMFLPSEARVHPFEDNDNLTEMCFPNNEYVGIFLSSIKDNFPLWNKQENEKFESSKAQLVDKYINMHTNGSIRNKAHIETEIARNKREYDDQLKKRFSSEDQKKLDDLTAKENKMQAQIKILLASCDEKTYERDEVESQIHQKKLIITERKEQVSDLQKILARQSFTQANFERKIATLVNKRQYLEVQKNALNQLVNMGLANQIHFARTLKQQDEVALRFNHMVHEKFLAMGEPDWYSFEITDLTIDVSDMTNLRTQIDRIFRNIEVIQQRIDAESNISRENIASLKTRLQAATENHAADVLQDENLMEDVTTLKGKLKEVNLEVQDAVRLRQLAIDNIKEVNERLNLSINARTTAVSKAEFQIIQLRNDNNVAMNNYERMADKLLRLKREHQERLRSALNEIHNSVSTLNEMKKPK